MKKLLPFIASMALAFSAMETNAQLPDGSTAPDFTFTDMNSVSQNLYTYLNAGKVVVIDISAIWCGPCWSYHNTGALENFYNQFGPPGTNQAMVIWIEGDAATNDPCMSASAGCTGGPSQGNWLSGTPYPMCNPTGTALSSFMSGYAIGYYPTCYMICPDKKTTKVDQYTLAQLTSAMNAQCPPPTSALDASVSAVVTPNGTLCNASFTPVVTIRNMGSSALTSCTINYQVDATTVQTFPWTGNLTTFQTANVTLSSVTTTSGAHTFTAYTSSPNGGADGNPGNDQTISNFSVILTGIAVPVIEGFAGGVVPPTGWTLDNPDGGITWALSSVGGFGNGTNSAKIDIFSYSTIGALDYLASSPMDLSAATSADLAFSVAYARYSASYTDKLEVEASTNCGTSWTSVYSKSGTTLATAPDNTSAFTPTASQWRAETVSLNSYVGQSSVMIRFKCTNGYGNNLYIDDINITAIVSVNDIDLSSYVSVFPNPSAGNVFVNIHAENLGNLNVKIYNVVGEMILESNDNTSKNMKFDLSGQSNGMYFVEVRSGNGSMMQKVMLNK